MGSTRGSLEYVIEPQAWRVTQMVYSQRSSAARARHGRESAEWSVRDAVECEGRRQTQRHTPVSYVSGALDKIHVLAGDER